MVKECLDERIVNTKRKIASQCCGVFLWGIMIVLLYRQFYLGQQFSEYGDIFVVWLIGCAYLALGQALQGVSLFGGNRLMYVVVPGVISLTTLGIGLYRGTVVSLVSGMGMLIAAFAGALGMLIILKRVYQSWERKNLDEN